MTSATGSPDKVFLEEFVGIQGLDKALQGGDIVAAKRAVLVHYASRPSPTWPTFPLRMTRVEEMPDEELLRQAEHLLQHRFVLARHPEVRFGRRIDWRFNPTQDSRARWTRELHRHRWWAVLGEAYRRSGDERFASEWVQVMTDWVRNNHPPGAKNESDVAWTLMGVGMRCLIWPSAFSLFYPAKAFSDDAKLLMLRSILDHGRFLSLFHTHYNHLIRESNGLAYLSVYFPEFKRSKQWLLVALERLERELQNQVYRDGTHTEVSTGYQWLVVDEFEGTDEIQAVSGATMKNTDLRGRLKDMYRMLMTVIRPDGSFPQLNDGFMDPSPVLLSRLSQAGRRLEDEGLLYVGTRGIEGSPPGWCSRGLNDAGLYVMRSGWDRDARYLLFDCGPYGGPHGHEDKLSIEVYAYGQPFVVDPGSYTYHASDPYRDYFVGSCGHNTVVVAGLSQVRRWNPANHNISTSITGKCKAWVTDEAFDYVAGEYHEGYGEFRYADRPSDAEIIRDVRHTRHILFVKPDYWLVLDRIESSLPRDFEILFHTAPDVEASIEPGGRVRLASSLDGVGMYLVPLAPSPTKIELIKGGEDPIQGWYSDGRANHKAPASTVILRFTGISRSDIGILLYPYKGSHQDIVHVECIEVNNGAGCCVHRTNGKDYIVLGNESGWRSLGPHRSCAFLAGFRSGADGGIISEFQWSPSDVVGQSAR